MVKYVATINGVSVTQNYSSSATVSFSMGTVNSAANATLFIQAIDSRGNSTTTSKTITILPYSAPVVKTTSTRNNGFDDPSTVTLNGSYSSNVPNNGLVSVQYQYKKTTDGSYGSLANFTYTTSSGTYTATNVGLTLSNAYSWNVRVIVTDKLSSTTVDNVVSAGSPIVFMDATLKSVGLGMFPTGTGTFETAGEVIINKQGDGAELLKFNTERAWAFLQSLTGAAANLDLKSLTNTKNFRIMSPNKVALNVAVDDANPVSTFY
jgi:hypothetical protein